MIAYLAARIISRPSLGGIHDLAASSWAPFTAAAALNHLSIYDHDRASMVSVTGPPGDLYIYDCASGRHVEMKINGSNFSGYDFETMAYFSGSVNGADILFCDFQHSAYFKYSTQPPPGSRVMR